MEPKNFYTNPPDTVATLGFFKSRIGGSKEARLACPFFMDYQPVGELINKGYKVFLLVKLGPFTSPDALQKALDDRVSVRCYREKEGDKFHAKFYIIGDKVLMGSANLTRAGLTSNHEASVVFERGKDERFERLCDFFKRIFHSASDELTQKDLDDFKRDYLIMKKAREKAQKVENKYKKRRSNSNNRGKLTKNELDFLVWYREKLIPAYEEVEEVYKNSGNYHPDFKGKVSREELKAELFAFFGWLARNDAKDQGKQLNPKDKDQREKNINGSKECWMKTRDKDIEDDRWLDASGRILERRDVIKREFANVNKINNLSDSDFYEVLCNCHAFSTRQGISTGEKGRKEFFKENSRKKIKKTISYLLHGDDADAAARVYQCVDKNNKLKLKYLGDYSAMELIGWVDPSVPPVNSRVIRSLRFLGFDLP